MSNQDDYNALLDEAHRRGYIVTDRSWVMGYIAGRQAAQDDNTEDEES